MSIGNLARVPPEGRRPPLAFTAINAAALPHLETLCRRWLPGGRRIGGEWVYGRLRGEADASCKVNLRTGRWADFNGGAKGGDTVSLAAAVAGIGQVQAARNLARMFGLEGGE